MRLTTIVGLLLILVFMSPVTTYSALFNSLKEDIQEELDVNPFLKRQGIVLKAIDTEGGYVTLKMQKGNRKIRKRISEGNDIELPLWENLDTGEKNTLVALRQTIALIKSMNGVKAVLIEALVNKSDDIAEDLEKKLSNEPVWAKEVVQNDIYPGIGMAGIKLGDPIDLVIKKFGKPTSDKIEKINLSDGRQENQRYVRYRYRIGNIGFKVNDEAIIVSMWVGGFHPYSLPKIHNTNIDIGTKYDSIGKELGLIVSQFELLRDKKSKYEFEIYNYKGIGLTVFRKHKNKDDINKVCNISVPSNISSPYFTFKEIK